MKNVVALEGKPQLPWSREEKLVYAILSSESHRGQPLSALGLSRWISNNPDLMKADKKIAAAAESLWAGGYIAKDEDNNYSCE